MKTKQLSDLYRIPSFQYRVNWYSQSNVKGANPDKPMIKTVRAKRKTKIKPIQISSYKEEYSNNNKQDSKEKFNFPQTTHNQDISVFSF